MLELVDATAKPDLGYFAHSMTPGVLPLPGTTPFDGLTAYSEEEPTQPLLYRPCTTALEEAKQLRQALDQTLERILGAAKRVAVMTGGGLDSGGLLCLVKEWSERHGRSYFAVAIDFEDVGDDRPYLAELEAHLRCEIVRVRPEAGTPFFQVVQVGMDGAPQVWPNAAMELAVYARAKAEGADCIITGLGGDQLLDGEPRALARLALSGRPFAAIRTAEALRGFRRPARPAVDWVLRPALALLAPRELRSRLVHGPRLELPSWAGRELVRRVERERERQRQAFAHAATDRVGDASREVNRANLALHRHQIRAVLGVRRFDPFMDAALQRYRDEIPPAMLLAGDIRRGLFRQALSDVLPAGLLRRADKAFFTNAFRRFLAALGGFSAVASLSAVRTLAHLELVDSTAFEAAFRRFTANPQDGRLWGRVWPVLMLESFARGSFSQC